MAGESDLVSLKEAIVNLDFDGIHKAADSDNGRDGSGMAVVGDKFESGHPVAVAPIVLNSLSGLYSRCISLITLAFT